MIQKLNMNTERIYQLSISPEVRPVGWAGLTRSTTLEKPTKSNRIILGLWAANATWVTEVAAYLTLKPAIDESDGAKFMLGSSVLIGVATTLMGRRKAKEV